MRPRDIGELLLLAAIWGASFMFMRLAVPSFGAVPVAGLRMFGAVLLLLPIVVMRGEWPVLRRHVGTIAVVGIVGSALPFVFYAVASTTLSTGTLSILNATTPMWGALVVWAWMGERSTGLRALGLLVGFAGVAGLAWDQAATKAGAQALHPALAVIASLCAALCYAFVAAFTKKKLQGVAPMAVAAGSQLIGSMVLALPVAWTWPSTTPGAQAWGSAVALALLCTGVAYLLYFRLIAHIGASNATSVTFLIPLFAVMWGTLLLSEPITPAMVVACVLVLLGTALSTGVIGGRTAAVAKAS